MAKKRRAKKPPTRPYNCPRCKAAIQMLDCGHQCYLGVCEKCRVDIRVATDPLGADTVEVHPLPPSGPIELRPDDYDKFFPT